MVRLMKRDTLLLGVTDESRVRRRCDEIGGDEREYRMEDRDHLKFREMVIGDTRSGS